MSLHLNWLAVQDGDTDALLTRLGFRKSGWVSTELRARLACATLPNGWTVIVSRDYGLKLETLLPTASAAGVALGCEVSDVVMYSSAQAWRHGQLAWAVTHDPDKDRDGVATQGEPPPQLAEIGARLAGLAEAEPDEPVDWWFDAPVELAKSVCGYEVGVVAGVEWFTLAEGAAAGPQRRRARSLRDSIRSELMPLLQSAGWEPGGGRADWPNAFYSASRTRDGRFEFIYLVGKDDGQETYLFPSFAAWPGATSDGAPLVAGEVRRPPASLWTRLAQGWRKLTGASGADERLEAIVADARRDLMAVDAFLARGEASPDLRFELGSAQAWRDALRAGGPDAGGA